MSSQAQVIREFLVRLGYKIDQSEERKFDLSLLKTTKFVTGLAASLVGMAAAAAAATVKTASQFEKLYYSTERMGTTVRTLKSFEYAVKQMGGTTEGALGSAKAFSEFLRTYGQGATNYLKRLGVDTSTGDHVEMLFQYMEILGKMDEVTARAHLGLTGVDVDTLLAAQRGLKGMREEYERLADAVGHDEDALAKKSKKFMQDTRSVFEIFGKLGNRVMGQFVDEFGPKVESLSRKLQGMLPNITKEFDKMAHAVGVMVKGISGGAFLRVIKELQQYSFGIDTPAGNFNEGMGLTMARIKAAFGDKEARAAIEAERNYNRMNAGLSYSTPKRSPKGPQGSGGSQGYLSFLEKVYGLPAGLLDSVWEQESGRGKNMLSKKGAMGHFQFMPNTAKEYGLGDPFNFEQSAHAAAQKYKDLLARYGNLQTALAAYNWGDGNLAKNGMGGMPNETRNYVSDVMGRMRLGGAGGGGSQVSLEANTTIIVEGAGDPAAVGRRVGDAQSRVNADLIRNFETPVR